MGSRLITIHTHKKEFRPIDNFCSKKDYLCRKLNSKQNIVNMKNLAIIGCGKLAGVIAKAHRNGLLDGYKLTSLYSRSKDKAEKIAEMAGDSCTICGSWQEIIDSKPDIIAETASPAAMKEFAIPALQKGISIVTLSIGAFADNDFLGKVKEAAAESGAKVYIASGATGGFDILRAATLMGNAKAEFFNEKGPAGLKNTEAFDESLLTRQKTVFQGTATEAIAMFPTKVNVTVAASLASVGPENMNVRIQSSPYFTGDTQKVEIRNDQVRAVVDIYSATSEIAGWSVVSVLRNIISPIVF